VGVHVGAGEQAELFELVDAQEVGLVQLCRCLHSWTYADPATMPTIGNAPADPLVSRVISAAATPPLSA